ncbi:MAG TPA: methionyl-tRNA formyltransferase [Rhabdochlamydiaceae bacterium]|nr:methionyl-tRNA formyltransferase [Rhabdochlamydiaceae bacterium]
MRIVYFGTPPFAAKVLQYLVEKKVEIVAIVTRPEKPRGRTLKMLPSAVKELAQTHFPQIPIFEPVKASAPDFVEILKSFHPDLFVVVAFGEILKKNLLDVPTKGSINVHASLLPKYRGAAPMQRSLMDGVKETGVTIIDVAAQMDAGAIYKMAKIAVPEEMVFGELEEKLCQLACPNVLEVIQEIDAGSAEKTEQNHAEATFAPKIMPEEEKIEWNRPAHQIHNLIRALSPAPGAWCLVKMGDEQKRLKIKRAQLIQNIYGHPGETLSFSEKGWVVACQKNGLNLLEVQLEGKKSLPIKDFYIGTKKAPALVI